MGSLGCNIIINHLKTYKPNVFFSNLKEGGVIISLIKPHYEAPKEYLENGKLKEDKIGEVLEKVKDDITAVGGKIIDLIESPIVGEKGKNREFLALIIRQGEALL